MPLPKRFALPTTQSLVQTGPGRNTTDYESNQNIFVQGEVADSVFFIQQGRVKVTVTSDHGKDAVVGILAEGQFFGEGYLHGQPLRTAPTKALCPCRITSIAKAAMLSAIRNSSQTARWPHGCRAFFMIRATRKIRRPCLPVGMRDQRSFEMPRTDGKVTGSLGILIVHAGPFSESAVAVARTCWSSNRKNSSL
jgi:hypothetical protein